MFHNALNIYLIIVATGLFGAWLPSRPVLAGEPAAPQANLDARLRKLEKEIAAVRGLEFKAPVAARIIARPMDATKKIQGFYNLKEKALFVYDDVSGDYELGVLVHEMVHALQDQHFSLAKLHQTTFGSDAELALAALIEGDATYTMIELLKKDRPRVTAMLAAPLDKAHDIQGAFLYAQGARYVKALKERGGWGAVNAAYRHPPRATAAVLHPEGVQTIDLGFGTTRGELSILKMLAAQPATAPLAVEAAAGWKGDRYLENGPLRSWVIALATNDDALQLQSALAKLKAAQNPHLHSIRDEPGATTWTGLKGNIVAVLARGERVLVLEAPDGAAYKTLSDRLEGPLDITVCAAKDGGFITFGQLVDRLLEADLVCVGEVHDSELQHRVQLQIIKAIHARDERLAVGMEMFQRPFQKEIDRYFQSELKEDEFLKASEYRQRWGYDWSLYRPIVEFCRRNQIPLAALNAAKELTGRVSKVGHAGLSDQEKNDLGDIDFHVREHRDYWFERLATMHGQKSPTPEQKERSYQVMTVWDDYMAASAAGFQQARSARRLIVLAGSGHIDRGFGIPNRAAKRTGGKAVTVRIEIGADPEKAAVNPVADYIVIVKKP